MLSKINISTTNIFLSKETTRVEEVAKKVGIVLPSTHTAIFESVFAPIETANNNKIRLAEEAVRETLPQLIGSQVNLNHMGKGFLLGIILDSWVNEDTKDIHIIFSFAKNIYSEEYILALEAMAEKKLSVSFELSSDLKAADELNDGTLRLNDIQWEGVGLLIDKKPAYKNAKVYEMAETYKERAIESEKELIFASQIIESCEKILAEENSKPEIGGMLKMTEEQKKLVAQLRAELGEFIPKDISDDVLLDANKVAEFKASKQKAEEKIAKDALLAESKKLSDEKIVISTIYKDDGSTEMVQHKICTYSWTDSEGKTQSTLVESVSKEILKYSEADMEHMMKAEDVASKVAELQAIIDSQKAELDNFKAEDLKRAEEAKKVKLESIKAGLRGNKYVAEFKDEDYFDETKIEKAKLLQERDNLKAENESLKKTTVVAATNKVDIETGHKEEATNLNPRAIIAKLGKK